jgi:hypothetical protein
MMMLAMMMMLMAPMLIANSLSGKQIYQLIEIRNEHIMIGADMNEITEQEMMDALDELMKAGKVRSFVKEGGDPLNPDDWLYEAIKSVD